jgi:hypothetical protein
MDRTPHIRETDETKKAKKTTKHGFGIKELAENNEKDKATKRKEYETGLFTKEHEKRKEINNLTYNVVHDAIGKLDELKNHIGDTHLQKQDITKMRAFRHDDGRILLGSIENVTKAFNNDRHHIDQSDLDSLEVGHKKNKITRINIDDGLIEILKERGFKADIAKRGTNGELEKVGTVHAKWNGEEGKMNVTFDEYKVDQSNRGREASSQRNKPSVEVALGEVKKGDPKPDKDDGTGDPNGGLEPVTIVTEVAANDAAGATQTTAAEAAKTNDTTDATQTTAAEAAKTNDATDATQTTTAETTKTKEFEKKAES